MDPKTDIWLTCNLQAPFAVELLARALASIDPSGRMLTSNHLALAKLAYHTNNAAAALPVLSKDIVFFPGMASHRESERLSGRNLAPPSYISKDTGLTLPMKSSQVLEFDYILGLLHLSVRAWAPAHAAFARVVSYPTRENGVSKIMVEAHKFWVLTGLLLFGHVASSPHQTATAVNRVCASVNKLYGQVAELFLLASAESLQVEVALAHEVLTADGTLSLVTEVVAAHPKWQIAHLRRVYTKISVAAIRQTLQRTTPAQGSSASRGPDAADDDAAGITEAEVTTLVQGMIESGMIKAALRPASTSAPTPAPAGSSTIGLDGGQQGAYLEFLPEEEEITEAEFAQRIATVETRIQALKPLHAATEEHLSLNREYIRQHIRDLMREKERGAADDDGMGGMMGYDADPDEDLMMDGPDPVGH